MMRYLPTDEPTINIVGDIDDRAGNRLDDDIEIEVSDGLPPQVESVTLSGGSGLNDRGDELTNDDIIIQIQINEDIAASNVTVEFWRDEDDSDTDERVEMSDDANPRKVRGEGAYELDYSGAGNLLDGDVYVVVIAEDSKGNRAVFGAEDRPNPEETERLVLIVDDTEPIEKHRDETVFEFDAMKPELDNDNDGLLVNPPGENDRRDDRDADDISGSDVRKNLVIIFHEEVSAG